MISRSQAGHGDRRLTYVLPSYDSATGTHLAHLYDFIRATAGKLDLLLVVERSASDPSDLAPRAYRQRRSWPPLRFAELFSVLLGARIRGCRTFYIHYSFYGAIAAWMVTRLAGGTVYYWNSGMPWLYRRPWLMERIFHFVLRRTILVTGTQSLKEEYRRCYALKAERIRVLPNWVTASRFQGNRALARRELGIPPAAVVLLFVHRLSRRKGADLIPVIAAEVTKQQESAMFLIVGDGPERAKLEAEIRRRKLEDRVRLIGEVPNRKIPSYFVAADVFFMPSEEEGFPHVLLEAMAAGLPYVASDVGGVSEITPPALQPFLVPSGDTERFVERLTALLRLPPEERARISVEARAWAERYDLREVLPKFRALFQ